MYILLFHSCVNFHVKNMKDQQKVQTGVILLYLPCISLAIFHVRVAVTTGENIRGGEHTGIMSVSTTNNRRGPSNF